MAKESFSGKERLYIVNLRKGFIDSPLPKKGRVAMRYLRKYFLKHLKAEKVNISGQVNNKILERGPRMPLNRIKVKVLMEGDLAKIMLPDEKEAVIKKKVRRAKPMDTKTKLQEMLASRGVQPSAKEPVAEKKEAPKEEKEKSAEEKFEEQISADKAPKKEEK